MATITPAPGKGSVVKCNTYTLKLATWRRSREASPLEFPTTGMAVDADGNYEIPHIAGLVKSSITIEGPYDSAAPFFGAPYNIRAGTVQTFQFGHVSGGAMTPSSTFLVASTTDENEAAALGKWSATLHPATDTSAGYYTSV